MEIKISDTSDDIFLVELTGSLDFYNSTKLKESFIKKIGEKMAPFIINLNKVSNINSTGIGALIYIFSTLKKLNCPLVLLASEGPVIRALETTRLKNYFTVAGSMEEAISLAVLVTS
jgi:anti-sigma B factor antagonist